MADLTVASDVDSFMAAANKAAMLAVLNITLGGAFTTSGSFTTTLTVTGNTNVTLPTSGTLAILGANTFTGAQTIASGTLSDSVLALNITQTWNDAAEAFVASEISITDTASISSAANDNYFQRFKVGGSVVGGFINYYGTLAARVREVQLDYVGHGITAQNSFSWNMLCASKYMASVRATELRLAASVSLTWKSDNAPYSGDADTKISRVSSGVLKITDGLDVLGTLDVAGLKAGGVSGANFTGTPVSITIVNGIVTAAS
jgi:autotransporter-associated beta strand protein